MEALNSAKSWKNILKEKRKELQRKQRFVFPHIWSIPYSYHILLFSCNRIHVFVKSFHFNWDDSRDWYNIDTIIWLELGLHCVSWLLKDLFCWHSAQRCWIVKWREKKYTFSWSLQNPDSVINWLSFFRQVA